MNLNRLVFLFFISINIFYCFPCFADIEEFQNLKEVIIKLEDLEIVKKIDFDVYDKIFNNLSKDFNFRAINEKELLDSIIEKYGLELTQTNRYAFLIALSKIISDYTNNNDSNNYEELLQIITSSFDQLASELSVKEKEEENIPWFKKKYLWSLLGLIALIGINFSFLFKMFNWKKSSEDCLAQRGLESDNLKQGIEQRVGELEHEVNDVRQYCHERVNGLEQKIDEAVVVNVKAADNITEHCKKVETVVEKYREEDEAGRNRGFWGKFWNADPGFNATDVVGLVTKIETGVGIVGNVLNQVSNSGNSDSALEQRLRDLPRVPQANLRLNPISSGITI